MGEAFITRRGGGGVPLKLIKDGASFTIGSNVSLTFTVAVNSLADGAYLLRAMWRYNTGDLTLPNGTVQSGAGIASVQIPFVVKSHAVTNDYSGDISMAVDSQLYAGRIRPVSLSSYSDGRLSLYGGSTALIHTSNYEFLELAVYSFDR